MNSVLVLATIAIILVVIFDYTNGFSDAANIIATVIASRAMTPIQAVIVVAVFEFLGPILGGTAVANAIGKFIDVSPLPQSTAMIIVLCGIVGAISWNLLTWWFGIPSSSSHALVGGLVGATLVAAGAGYVKWGFGDLMHGKVDGVAKILVGLVLSPLIGFGLGWLLQKTMMRIFARAKPGVNKWFRRSQFVTSAFLAFSHGANDAQKSMGIITLVLLLSGQLATFAVPFWVILTCASAITLGILSGGWRIVRTVGFGIFKVRPLHALDTQLTAAAVISAASILGAPVSTTHVVSSSIMGIGTAERPKAVRWGKAQEILSTWIITIPGSAVVGVLCYLVSLIFYRG
ncbi:MAG: inorganic phosphate transporter [Candidatus Phosphoribacter sp.]